MDITSENFESSYEDIIKTLNECDFMAIDCELSGITNFKHLNYLDTPKIRYEKLKKNDLDFLIIQVGVCFFKKHEDQKYKTDAYNFYVFPKSEHSKFTKQVTFTCQNTSIEFLIQNNFDFNKLFKHGISYISKMDEERIRYNLMASQDEREERMNNDSIIFPSKNAEFNDQLTKIIGEIDAFSNDQGDEKTKDITFPEMPFLLKIYIEKNIRQRYGGKIRYEHRQIDNNNKEHHLILTRIDTKDKQTELDKELGISKLFWEISKSGKMIVGHNMMTDVMQIVKAFFYSPLPNSHEEFKSLTHSIFPLLLDTKHMATQGPLKDLINNSALGNMHKILIKEPFTNIPIENCKYDHANEKLHEAGYDAFLTGCCYVNMYHYLESANVNKKSFMDPYLNKIHLMKTYDLAFIDLVNEQPEPSRDNVLYMEMNKRFETQNVIDMFSEFGQIFVSWIDDSSALIYLKEEKNFKKAVTQMVGVPGNDYKIYFYKTYLNKIKEKSDNGATNSTPNYTQAANDIATKRKMVADDTQGATPKKTKEVTNGQIETPQNGNDKPFAETKDW